MKIKEKGISLIVLVITIVIIIILASVVILNVTKNNPIDSAKKAKFLSDIDNIKTELEIYVAKKQTDTLGEYNRDLLQATKDKVSESGTEDTSKNITDIIESIKGTKYEDKLQIEDGKLIYVGKDKDEINWSIESGIDVTAVKLDISVVLDSLSISGKIKVSGNLVEASKIEKYEIYITKKDSEYSSIASKVIEKKDIEVEYNIDELKNGETYKMKVLLFMDGQKYQKEITNITTIKDNEPPNIDEIKVKLTPNEWTSQNVTVELENIPVDAVVKQYTLPNKTQWIDYIGAFEVFENGVINIRLEDKVGNESTKTIIIEKIDKTPPTVAEFEVSSTQNIVSIKITKESTDSQSGLSNYIIELEDESGKVINRKENVTSQVSSFNELKSNSKYYVKVISIDNVVVGDKNIATSNKMEVITSKYDIDIESENSQVNLFDNVTTKFIATDIKGAKYRWYYNNTLIDGALSSTYSISTSQMNLSNYKGGIYKVEVTIDGYTLSKQAEHKVSSFEISSANELKAFSNRTNNQGITFEGDTIRQVSDIDLSTVCGANIGNWESIAALNEFKGTYDGNNHKIFNLYINAENISITSALFCRNVGTIKNIEIESGSIIAKNCISTGIAALVCSNDGVVENCGNNVDVTVIGNRPASDGNERMAAGGIASGNRGIVRNCYNKGNISGQNRIGGIVGDNTYGGRIYNCYNTGTINIDDYWGGGISGANWNDSVIENSYNVGMISTNKNGNGNGNIAGVSNGTISNCYYLKDIPGKGANEADIEGKTIPKDEDSMKTLEFINMLNSGGTYFKLISGKNNNYPVLEFEK